MDKIGLDFEGERKEDDDGLSSEKSKIVNWGDVEKYLVENFRRYFCPFKCMYVVCIMYIYAFIDMHVCICMYIYVYLYVCMYVCMYVYTVVTCFA